jgi:hypothetical protein
MNVGGRCSLLSSREGEGGTQDTSQEGVMFPFPSCRFLFDFQYPAAFHKLLSEEWPLKKKEVHYKTNCSVSSVSKAL